MTKPKPRYVGGARCGEEVKEGLLDLIDIKVKRDMSPISDCYSRGKDGDYHHIGEVLS